MTWVKIDDGMPEHPDILALSASARWALVAGLCYANRALTDGFIPEVITATLGTKKDVSELVKSGKWERVAGGYAIHDYLDYQPSRQEVLAKRQAAKERKDKYEERKKERVPNASEKRPVNAIGTPPHPDPSHPTPVLGLELDQTPGVEGGPGGGLSPDQVHLLDTLSEQDERWMDVAQWVQASNRTYGGHSHPATEALRRCRSAQDSGLDIANPVGMFMHHENEVREETA